MPASSKTSSCRRPSRCRRRWSRRSARTNVFASAEDRVRHATGRGYVDLARLRCGRLDAAPDAVLLPADADAVRRVLDVCAAEGVAVVPSAAAPASSAASSRCAARTRAWSASTWRGCARSRSTALADRAARRRPARPRGRSGAERPGRRPRPLPAVLRVRDDRRLRRDPLGRAGLDGYGRFDALVSAMRLIAPAGELRTLERRTPRPGRPCASWRSARRASSG